MKKDKEKSEKKNEGGISMPQPNRRARRRMKHYERKQGTRLVHDGSKAEFRDGAKVYKDDSFKDKSKRAIRHGMQYVKDRLDQAKATFDRPEKIDTVRKELLTKCVVLNRDGKRREFLPDVKPQHKILVHGNIAKVMISEVCMLVRITKNEDSEGRYIDGSWAITPASVRMIGTTDIQHVRRRPFFFLRRYWYEINFDGRVQPASLFFDYDIDVTRKRQALWVTREYVPVAKTDKFNDYFRFWKHKPDKQ